LVLLASAAALAAETSPPTTFVRGFRGEPVGGFLGTWYTHLGAMPLYGVRQRKEVADMQWKSAPLPATIPTETVTFVWSGAMGAMTSGNGFTISVNGHAAADCNVLLESAQFPARKDCRLLYDVLYTLNMVDSSGHFYLTVPKAWVKAGEAAVLQVKAADSGAETWFALVRADDAPLAIPDHTWTKLTHVARRTPGSPPPAGEEAAYDWYLTQYPDPRIYTPIGPPGDPAEVVVFPDGQLQRAGNKEWDLNRAPISGTLYLAKAMSFGLFEEGHASPMDTGCAQQSLEDGCLPIVITDWKHDDITIRQRATAEPLRGSSYETGRESTLAWAIFDITNNGKEPRDVTFFAAEAGDDKNPKRNLSYQHGVVLEDGSARCWARVPAGFTLDFQAALSGNNKLEGKVDRADPRTLLREGGLYNALLMRGRIEPGQTARVAVNRVVDFPGTLYWSGAPPKVAAEELTSRSPEQALDRARSTWGALAAAVSRVKTPDAVLNRVAAKAMLDGYFLTKRWNGRDIVFDSICYRCQWDDSSTKWFYALDLMGDHATAGKLLETVFARQGQRKPAGTHSHEGCFSDVTNIAHDGSAASWTACNGWALWAMAEHARLADDRPWLAAHKKAILDGCQWIIRERNFSKEKPNNPCYGLLSGKFVCDMPDASGGVSGVDYFAYSDAISYLGLHEIAQVLSDWGYPEGRGLLAEAESYRQDIVAAIDRLTDKSSDPWYVPWDLGAPKVRNEYLNGVCGPINLAFGGVLSRDDQRIAHVIRWNLDHIHKGSPEESATANMFYSQDLAIILLEQGRVEDFLRIFYTILAADVSHQTLTTCEWRTNTQPHIHSIASLIRMFRTMMVQERDGGLYLLQGAPRRWLEDKQKIAITALPTWYGPLSLDCVSHVADGNVRLRLAVPERLRAAPIHLKLRLPRGLRIGGVTVDGQPGGRVDGEWIVLSGLKGSVEIVVQTAAAASR
jgi:hypothetical protein